ncbi:hypothetical protein JFY74_04535 [Pectobacterium carotovorum]|uniref:XRE family transcriptional regulator n=1 Tax=Pectobacterium odoriferum TaxID=78398 RepID=A0ABR4VJZ5_9GAMM|nr:MULTISPECIES: hypothetical protein [Pectobacterium]AZK61362.1 hypothetical protein EIP93_03070 [Pectobacterium versatile]KGA39682.1 hypothetical protein KU75_21115 [Pectobacterium odoriferum]MCU1793482.1 hypothetical protein [Pectobacterium polaris]QQG29338.1 hypothetical protein JFY74_04535 [Pectobacterium carotovorum]
MVHEKETIDYTVRGFSREFDITLTHLSILWSKPKSVILRELAEQYLTDRIKMFGMMSKHVAALDEMMARNLGAELIELPYESHITTGHSLEMAKLLTISSDEQLEDILVRNTPYIMVRANQVIKGTPRTVKGMTLWFALFAEVASSSPDVVKAAWEQIFNSFNAFDDESYYRYYKNINEIRALMNKVTITADLHDVRHEGKFCTVAITKPADYAYGAWLAVITLTPAGAQIAAKAAAQEALSGLCYPTLEKRQIVAKKDTGYHAMAFPEDGGEMQRGFTFIDDRCELNVYSKGYAGSSEFNHPTPLKHVAEVLASLTDAHLKPFLA